MTKLKWIRQRDLAIVRGGEFVPREMFLDCMTFRGGPLLFTELFGPMVGLKERWEAAGATPAELDFSAFRYRAPVRHRLRIRTGMVDPALTEIYEDDDLIRSRDAFGREWEMHKGVSTLAMPCSHPVRNMDDWLKIKHHYAWSPARIDADCRDAALAARARGEVIEAGLSGAFHTPRQLMGEEALCLACYDQPELLHDILDTIADSAYRAIEHATREVPLDVLFISEDIAGNNGSLWGPAEITRFMRPYYQRLWTLAQERGARLFDLDSDGNVESVLEAILDCGVNAFRTMEPAAGMDLIKTRRQYGNRLALIGGLDKFAVAQGREAIDRELETKIPPLRATGACLLSLDHRIPANTPLENYRYYLNKVWELLDA